MAPSQNHTPKSMLPPELAEMGQGRLAAWAEAARQEGIDLPLSKGLAAEAALVLALSDFVSRSLLARPGLLADLIHNRQLTRACTPSALRTRLKAAVGPRPGWTDANLKQQLRHLRRKQMVRIAWRDLSGRADLGQTLADLSALADACLDHGLHLLHQRLTDIWGRPCSARGRAQHLVVLAMGKLGARELNFSSDIDLIFAFPEAGRTRGGRKSCTNEEFFTILARQLVQVINETTPEGFVFRVDTDLRPYGESGPMVMAFDAMEAYYQSQGREWERYAWIKARAAAGDVKAGAALLKRLNPFVYRRYLDYGVYDALREMKKKISAEVKRKNLIDNVKLGPGGIREIEFFGQIFQLTRGGVVPALQEPGIQTVLPRLAEQGLIKPETARQLDEAYVFLRRLENRLQEADDRQTHEIPADGADRLKIAVAMGFGDSRTFYDRYLAHTDRVHRHFEGLLQGADTRAGESSRDDGLTAVWSHPADGTANRRILKSLGYDDPDQAAGFLEGLNADPATRALSPEGRRRLDRLMPLVIRAAGASGQPAMILGRIIDLIKSIQRRTSYIALMVENPAVLDHLVRFAEASPWLADFVAQHPVLLDELLEGRTLHVPPTADQFVAEAVRRLATVDADDLESQIEALCIFKQINILRVAAADVAGNLPLMKVSDQLSWLAEAVIDRVLEIAWGHLEARHGRPATATGQRGFAVAAYGKLGGLELGYDSDLDLVFLFSGAQGLTRGKAPIDNGQFYARLGQRMVHILTAPTRAGRLYAADMRLRPSGSSGPLVSPIEAFAAYMAEEAWTWEHQAIVRARAVVGDPELMAGFEALRRQVLTLKRDHQRLRADVADMRERLRQEHGTGQQTAFDLKQDPGGMVDIEFLSQYLVLCHSHQYPELAHWSDNVRILESLIATGVVAHETAHVLKQAYLTYRSAAHRLALQSKPAKVAAETFAPLRRQVRRIWQTYLGESL